MTRMGKLQCSDKKIYWIADKISADDFPDVSSALRDPDGLLAIGGDLQPSRLLNAYQRGIFPWYNQGQPILWWSPNPRCVLSPDEVHISTSLRKTLRQHRFQVTFNQAFEQVIRLCAGPRDGKPGTWISEEIIHAYKGLYDLGNILSAECWYNGNLVGGLYGIVIGKVYFGESMFSKMSNASKVAMVHLAAQLQFHQFQLIDCQIYSTHMDSLGAKNISRDQFVNILKHYCQKTENYNWPRNSLLL